MNCETCGSPDSREVQLLNVYPAHLCLHCQRNWYGVMLSDFEHVIAIVKFREIEESLYKTNPLSEEEAEEMEEFCRETSSYFAKISQACIEALDIVTKITKKNDRFGG